MLLTSPRKKMLDALSICQLSAWERGGHSQYKCRQIPRFKQHSLPAMSLRKNTRSSSTDRVAWQEIQVGFRALMLTLCSLHRRGG